MRKPYVGVYWTLPVNWIGFRSLPTEIEAACAASQTIRYQRERVKRFLHEDGGALVSEIAFMDVRTDRATDAVLDVLRRHAQPYVGKGVSLLTVAFDEAHSWRRNPFLLQAARELQLELHRLSPDPLLIDGTPFDPRAHFEEWRQRDRTAMEELGVDARAALYDALEAVPEGRGRRHKMAARMNDVGIKTIRGGAWTAENVRKLVSRLSERS